MNLLIADDEERIRNNFKKRIERSHLQFDQIFEARNGKEALKVLQDNTISIALVDINMPFVNGLEFMEQAHLIHEDLIMIVISGYDTFSYAQKAIAFGVYRYLLKPVNHEEFIETIEGAMRLCDDGNRLVKTILSLMSENIQDSTYSLEDLSKRLDLSGGYITTLLKQETGMSFTEVLTNMRINHAKSLMEENPSIKIYEVSNLCGYSNQHYFSKVFKKVVGCSPKQYVK